MVANSSSLYFKRKYGNTIEKHGKDNVKSRMSPEDAKNKFPCRICNKKGHLTNERPDWFK